MITSRIDVAPILAKFGRIPSAMKGPLDNLAKEQAKLFVSNNRSGVPGMVQVLPPNSEGVTGKDGQKQGERAVSRDIYRVYTTPAKAFQSINASNPGLAKAFWAAAMGRTVEKTNKHGKLVKRRVGKNMDEAARLLAASGSNIARTPFGKFDGGALHQANRDRRGRVNAKRPSLVVVDVPKLTKYVREVQKRVGQLASSYLAAGLQFGSTGILAFIKRHGSKFSQVSVSSAPDRFLVRMTPTIPYGRKELLHRIPYVLRYRQEAMKKRLGYITRAAAKQAGIRQ